MVSAFSISDFLHSNAFSIISKSCCNDSIIFESTKNFSISILAFSIIGILFLACDCNTGANIAAASLTSGLA